MSGGIFAFLLFSGVLNSEERTKSEIEGTTAAGKTAKEREKDTRRPPPKDNLEFPELHLCAFVSPFLHHFKALDLFFANFGRLECGLTVGNMLMPVYAIEYSKPLNQ